MLSQLLWQQVQDFDGKVVFVEGSNTAPDPASVPPHISYYKQIARSELEPLIREASMVVCRSGYSTLMDLVALDKKAILIPTPGQTEQEYLGKHLHKEGVFFSMPQKNFNLKQALQDGQLFPFSRLALEGAFERYQRVVERWVSAC
jgi:predicted glycosyltransferase